MPTEHLERVLIHTMVTVELVDEFGMGEQLQFEIVADRAADFEQGLLGESTPLARAILGHAVGKTLPYEHGDIRTVRIISVTPSESTPAVDAAEQRRLRIEEALHEVERTNADMFASSFSGKWGNYNTDEFQDNPGKKSPKVESDTTDAEPP